MANHKPYVPADTDLKDFTVKAVIIGAIFGIMFGSANAYLGLRVGLTISTAIPLAVISVAVFRVLRPVLGKSTIRCNRFVTFPSSTNVLAHKNLSGRPS